MRRLLPLFAVFLSLLLVAPASAQTPGASPQATPETLPGLEYVAARQYAPDPTQPIDTEDDGVYILSARIYVFDTEEHADTGWDSTVNSTTIESQIPTDSDKVAYEEQDIDGLGDRARVVTLSAETPEGDTGYFRLIYVQEGRFLYTLSAIAGGADPTVVVDDLAAFMVDAEMGDGDVQFAADGTSTGGAWDLFPAPGEEPIADLTAFADAELDLRGN